MSDETVHMGYLTPTEERRLRAQGKLAAVPTADSINRLRHEIKSLEFEIRDASAGDAPTIPPEIASTCVTLPLIGMEPGVYLLMRGNVVVYVGSSISVASRVGQHVQERGLPCGKNFDTAVFIPCDADRRLAIEGALIRLLTPEHNGNAPVSNSADDEVLVELGITPHPRLPELSQKRRLLAELRSKRARAIYGTGGQPQNAQVAAAETPKPEMPKPIKPDWRQGFVEALKAQKAKRR